MGDLPVVLIVDDDEEIRDAVAAVVSHCGLEAASVANGLEALRYLGTCERLPSLILLDLMMPIMDGWELLRRRSDRWRAVPVVVLSGTHERIPVDVPSLQKPITTELLLHAIVSHCH